MKIDIPADVYADIAALIGSEASPVGIDAKKTHIIVLHKLIEIERRLARLERMIPDPAARSGLNAPERQNGAAGKPTRTGRGD